MSSTVPETQPQPPERNTNNNNNNNRKKIGFVKNKSKYTVLFNALCVPRLVVSSVKKPKKSNIWGGFLFGTESSQTTQETSNKDNTQQENHGGQSKQQASRDEKKTAGDTTEGDEFAHIARGSDSRDTDELELDQREFCYRVNSNEQGLTIRCC